MGITKIELSSKYINAFINDKGGRFFHVLVKQILGNKYFMTKIEGKFYLFELIPLRIKIWHHLGVRTIRKVEYDIESMLPIDTKQVKEMEDILNKNHIKKVDRKLLFLFDLLSKREKEVNADGSLKEPHKLDVLIAEAEQYKGENQQAVEEIVEYMRHLDIKQIATPVRPLSEFLHELKQPDPGFADEVLKRAHAVEKENKKLTNTPETGKGPWLKIIMVLVVVVMIIGVIAWAFASGTIHLPTIGGGDNPFSSITSGLSGGGGSTLTANSPIASWSAKYPTPESLGSALKTNEITCANMPKLVHDMVNTLNPKPCP